MEKYSGYVGLDVHKETISVGIARAGRRQPLYYGEIRNDPAAVVRLVRSPGTSPTKLISCRALSKRLISPNSANTVTAVINPTPRSDIKPLAAARSG